MARIVNIKNGEVSLQSELREFDEFHGISLCCITLNEEKDLKEFYEWHRPFVDFIVTVDSGSTDNSISIAAQYSDVLKSVKFNGNFCNQKNRSIELATNDWVLFLDPDERLSEKALAGLKDLINQNKYDCYSFPRKNYISGEEDTSHGDDYQERLFRSYCRYVRPVHAEIVGWQSGHKIDPELSMYISHKKELDRHEERNWGYTMFDMAHIRDLGTVEQQLKGPWEERFQALIANMRSVKEYVSTRKTNNA